jgi:uncharacterized protein YprB with RNaseH-like and TPR domain
MSTYTRRLARPLPPLPEGALPPGPVAYLDIESTGLSPQQAGLTLVGLVFAEGGVRVLEQYFVDHAAEEAAVLKEAARRLRGFSGVVTYNGARFDLPFLAIRAEICRVPWPPLQTYDLLQVAFAWQRQYKLLPNCRLQTVMAHFRLGRVDQTSGLEMVEAYRRWLQTGNPADRDLILDHNAEDLLLLPDLVPLLKSPPARGGIARVR